MKEQILSNIKESLSKPIGKEVVVYLMVELRKLIYKSKENLEACNKIKFWCDWVVHINLSGDFTKQTLKLMEDFLTDFPDQKFHRSEFNVNFVNLESFRWELNEFLIQNKLPNKIIDLPTWDDFCFHLLGVLKDCPLEKKDGLIRSFSFVEVKKIQDSRGFSFDYQLILNGTRPNIYGGVIRVRGG